MFGELSISTQPELKIARAVSSRVAYSFTAAAPLPSETEADGAVFPSLVASYCPHIYTGVRDCAGRRLICPSFIICGTLDLWQRKAWAKHSIPQFQILVATAALLASLQDGLGYRQEDSTYHWLQ